MGISERFAILGMGLALGGCGQEPRDDEVVTTAESSASTTTSGPMTGTGSDTDSASTVGQKLDVNLAQDLGGVGGAGCDDVEELPTNQGCEFWAVDLPNVSTAPLETTPHDQQFAVVVTNSQSDQTANVDVFVGAQTEPFDGGPVPPDTMRVFELPAMSITPGATTADGVAYRIESDLPITAYQFQPLDNTSPVYSNDATLLFPTHVLGQDYTAITGDATLASNDAFSASDANTGAFVSVVSIRDGTTVTLFPTAGVHAGPTTDVLLDRGQVLTAISSDRGAPTHGNLSGTRVAADAPVAVFSGSVATSEPSAANACCADHLEHQMLPLTAWGASYVAPPAVAAAGSGNDASLYRITATADGTSLEYSPAAPAGAPTTIDAYETVAFIADAPFAVSSSGGEAFAVSQFLLSNQYFPGFSRPGDPTMMLLAATEQYQTRYVFLVPQGYATNFVTVVAPSQTALTLDGAPAAGATAPAGSVGGTSYEYVHIGAVGGAHVIEAQEPFGIIVSGHANDVSYGYVGGSGVAVIADPPPPPG